MMACKITILLTLVVSPQMGPYPCPRRTMFRSYEGWHGQTASWGKDGTQQWYIPHRHFAYNQHEMLNERCVR